MLSVRSKGSSLTTVPLFLNVRRYFVLTKSSNFLLALIHLLVNLKMAVELFTVLATFGSGINISYRTYFIGWFSYVSRFLETSAKFKILLHNYSFIKKTFKKSALQSLFKNGLVCWSENLSGNYNEVVLATSKELEFEGSLSLFYKINGIIVYNMSFTFAPGDIFHVPGETIIFISKSQGVFKQLENISKATRLNKDTTPAFILIKIIESIADLLNIKSAIGVGVKNQLSFSPSCDYEKFNSNYDEFWKIFGGEKRCNEDFLLSFPLYHKPILLVRRKYRNRVLAKRNRLKKISNCSSANFLNFCKK